MLYLCLPFIKVSVSSQESESSYMCVMITVFYQARIVSRHICVRITVFYQARRVSGHICVRSIKPGE